MIMVFVKSFLLGATCHLDNPVRWVRKRNYNEVFLFWIADYSLRLEVDDLIMKHLSNFTIDRAKLSLMGPTITVNLSIPEIYTTGSYNMSGMLGDLFPLRGDGPFTLTVYDFRIYVNTVIGYSKGLYMKIFDLDFSLRSIRINLQNFMGGHKIGDLMNQVNIAVFQY